MVNLCTLVYSVTINIMHLYVFCFYHRTVNPLSGLDLLFVFSSSPGFSEIFIIRVSYVRNTHQLNK